MDITQLYEKLEKELKEVHKDVIQSKEELTKGITTLSGDFREHKANTENRFERIEEQIKELQDVQKTKGNRQYDWVKTIVGGAIVGIIVASFAYYINTNKTPPSNRVEELKHEIELQKLKNQSQNK